MASSRKNGLAVLFDSNFLMTAARLHFDVFHAVERRLDSPFSRKILSSNLQELKSLASTSNPATQREARVALKLADSCETVYVVPEENDPDDLIVRHARISRNIIVATNDAVLRAKLRRAGRPVLFMRRSGDIDLSGYEQ